MLTSEYDLLADPAEATPFLSSDVALSDGLMLEAAAEEETSVFSAPVLDRIRTSD